MLPRRLDVEKKLLLVEKWDFFEFDAKPVPDMAQLVPSIVQSRFPAQFLLSPISLLP